MGIKLNAPKEFFYLLKAHTKLVWVVTTEERRCEKALAATAARQGQGYNVYFWDCATGCTDLEGKAIDDGQGAGYRHPGQIFERMRQKPERAVWIMRDLEPWLADPTISRGLKSLARDLQDEVDRTKAQTVVCISTSAEVPPSLRHSATLLDWPLPDRDEIGLIIDDVVSCSNAVLGGDTEAIINAASGLTSDAIADAIARSLVEHEKVDPAIIRAEKKRIIDRERVLTWIEPDPRGLDAVGGLQNLKDWLVQRKAAFTPEARAFGLQVPRGLLIIGITGNGKSFVAKCLPTAWGGLPLLRMDLGALKSKYVGESEANIRRALKVAEACAPVVLWLDEIEKALSGAMGSNDGGVSADALNAILVWLQEREGSVFCVATANDVSALPPELSRKGRFDEIFFVDLPTESERAEILRTAILSHRRDPKHFNLGEVAKATPEFSGAEIAELVPTGMFTAFEAGRELNTADLVLAASATVPVSRSSAEKIEALRNWAQHRARRASAAEVKPVRKATKASGFGRPLDLGKEE